MAIMIREYLGNEGLQVDWNNTLVSNEVNISESLESVNRVSSNSIMVDIEGIHEGPTRNYTWYMEEALKDSIPSWTSPYLRPLIMHHNEKDGKIIGRIRAVELHNSPKSKSPALLFTANVPDVEGKEQIEDGRLNTVSIGVIVHEARCSICGANIAEMSQDELENHEHVRGQVYDGKTCYWMIKKMEAKELSYVIVPSDVYAQNVRVYKPTDLNLKENSKGVFSLAEQATEIKENTIIEENVDKQPEVPVVPTADVEALKKELEDAKGKAKELEKTVEDQKAQIDTLTANNASANKDLEDTKVLLDTAQKDIKAAQDKLTLKEAEIITEKTLREAAENNVINITKDIREGVIDNIVNMRQALKKPTIAKEELEKRSEDSLNDAIRDLKEEMNTNGINPITITPVTNPTIVENTDNSASSVKEQKNAGNIDLQEGLSKIFDSVIGSKSKIEF